MAPDGSRIAFVAAEAQGNRVYLRALNSAEATPVPGTEGSTAIFWSSDSRRLAVHVSGQLKVIDAADRSIRTLCDLPELVTSGTWNREGTIVFATLSVRRYRTTTGK